MPYLPEAGKWRLIPGLEFDNYRLPDTEADALGIRGTQGSVAALANQTGAAFDPEGRFWYFWGGGADAYGGNEVYRLDLSILQMSQITEPSILDTVVQNSNNQDCLVPSDGPASSSTYDGFVWSPVTQSFFVFPSNGFCADRHLNRQMIWEFEPLTGTWNTIAQATGVTGPVHAAYDPATNRIFYIETGTNASLRDLNPITGQLGSKVPLNQELTVGSTVLDPRTDELIVFAQEGVFAVSLSDLGAIVRLADVPDGFDAGSGVDFDIESGLFVLWDGTKEVRTFDAVTGEWTEQSPASGPTAGAGGVFSKWIVIEELGIFAGYHNPDEGLWLYRLPDVVTPGSGSPANQAPIALINPNQLTAQTGSVVTLDGTDSFDPDGDALSYAWSIVTAPSGAAPALSTSGQSMTSFTPTQAGAYVFRLTVGDGELSDNATVTVSVSAPAPSNSAPVADAGADQTLDVGQIASLNGSASSDPDGDGLTYNWSLVSKPADSTAVLSGTTSAGPTIMLDAAGTFRVQLVVNDGTLNSTADTVQITAQAIDTGPAGGGSGDGGSGSEPPSIPDAALVASSENPRWLQYANGDPFFMCGPGDPEDFLYRGTRNSDGTRDGDQMALIEKLAGTGANSIYMQMVRSHGGDGQSSHNPFVDSDPSLGLDEDILDQWETWFTAMDEAGIVIYLFFFDDDANIWGGGNAVPAAERDFIEAIVTRFKHHNRLVWVIAEEYQEEFSAQRVSNMAAIIRGADDAGHAIAVHKLNGLNFSEFADDSNIDQFAIQYNNKTAAELNSGMVSAFTTAAGRYGLNMTESKNHGTGSTARKKSWAVAMGGAYVMVIDWEIDNTNVADLEDCGRLVRFMETTDFYEMEPSNGLAFGGTEYVMASPSGSYILYASALAGEIGVRDLTPGTYDARWLDIATGTTVEQSDLSLAGGDTVLASPQGIGSELAVWIKPASSDGAEPTNQTSTGNTGGTPSSGNALGYAWDTLAVGTTVYVDRSYTYTEVPIDYQGLTVLRTANDDKGSSGSSFVTFNVDAPVTVFVAHDASITSKPDWLDSWNATGDVLSTNDTELELYRKDFPAGAVTLGGNGGTKSSSMYTVVVNVDGVDLGTASGSNSGDSGASGGGSGGSGSGDSNSGGGGSAGSDDPPPNPGNLSLLANYLPARGGWSLIPNTRFDDIRIRNDDGFDTQGDSRGVIDAWSGMAYDSQNYVMYFYGGGHHSYSGNEVYSLDLTNLSLVRRNDPSPLTDLSTDPEGCPLPAEGPAASHTYSGFVWAPVTQSAFQFSAMNFADRTRCREDKWRGNWIAEFDPATNSWHRRSGYSDRVDGIDQAFGYPSCGYNPTNNLIYCLGANKKASLRVYDPVQRRMLCESSSTVGSFVQDGTGRYRNGYLYFGDTKGIRRLFVDNLDGSNCNFDSAAEEFVAPPLPGTGNSDNNFGFDFAGNTIAAWLGDDRIWTFEIGASTDWDLLSATSSTSPTQMRENSGKTLGGRIYTKWVYLPALDAFAGYHNRAEGLWLYRLPTANSVPESDPPLSNDEPPADDNPPSDGGSGDTSFTARCADPGVVRCYGFDDPIDLVNHVYDSQKLPDGTTILPEVDLTTFASGGGAMRFTIPPFSKSNTSGGFRMNFTPGTTHGGNDPAYPEQFGEGETFYVQYRQRFDPYMISHQFAGETAGISDGFKQSIIGVGDQPGFRIGSCTEFEIVLQNIRQRATEYGEMAPQMYQGCPGSPDRNGPFVNSVGKSQWDIQPNGDGRYCRHDGHGNLLDSEPDCFFYKPNEWMTFEVRVRIGTWQSRRGPTCDTPERIADADAKGIADPCSEVTVWAAREGGEPVEIIRKVLDLPNGNWDDCPSECKYGKVWLLPFQSKKSELENHPETYTWYDELIISRNFVPFPE